MPVQTVRGRLLFFPILPGIGAARESGVPVKPPLYLWHRNDSQTTAANHPEIGLNMALEGRLAHSDGLSSLHDGESKSRRWWPMDILLCHGHLSGKAMTHSSGSQTISGQPP